RGRCGIINWVYLLGHPGQIHRRRSTSQPLRVQTKTPALGKRNLMNIVIESWFDVVAAILLVLGTLLSAVAGFGLLRYPDVLSPMHAATKPQVLGLFLVLAGLGFPLKIWTVVLVLIVAWFVHLLNAPVSAHLLGRARYVWHDV